MIFDLRLIIAKAFGKKSNDNVVKHVVFCVKCESRKDNKFCSMCKEETGDLYRVEICDAAKSKTTLGIEMTRDKKSVDRFYYVYSILLAIILSIIGFSLIESFYKILASITIIILLAYICFFGDGTRSFIIKFNSMVESHKEKK